MRTAEKARAVTQLVMALALIAIEIAVGVRLFTNWYFTDWDIPGRSDTNDATCVYDGNYAWISLTNTTDETRSYGVEIEYRNSGRAVDTDSDYLWNVAPGETVTVGRGTEFRADSCAVIFASG